MISSDGKTAVGESDNDHNQDWIDIGSAIDALRAQLTDARRRGADEDLRFELGDVTVEFGVEARKEGSGDAGVRFGVVSLGAKGSVSKSATHKVIINLKPRTRTGESVDIGDDDF